MLVTFRHSSCAAGWLRPLPLLFGSTRLFPLPTRPVVGVTQSIAERVRPAARAVSAGAGERAAGSTRSSPRRVGRGVSRCIFMVYLGLARDRGVDRRQAEVSCWRRRRTNPPAGENVVAWPACLSSRSRGVCGAPCSVPASGDHGPDGGRAQGSVHSRSCPLQQQPGLCLAPAPYLFSLCAGAGFNRVFASSILLVREDCT